MPLNKDKLRKFVVAVDPSKKVDFLSDDIKALEQKLLDKLDNFSRDVKGELNDRIKSWPKVPDLTNDLKILQEELDKKLSDIRKEMPKVIETPTEKSNIESKLEDLRTEFFSKLYTRGGGNANRNIGINGNPSVLSRYTDINLIAGNNIAITYSNNDATKYTDITIAGNERVTSILSVSSVLANSVNSTEYTFLPNEGVRLTMPTAIGNINFYTIKNIGSSSVLVSTTAGQTIDGGASATLTTQYESINLISNNSNWFII